MKPLARSLFLSLLSLATVAACVEPIDTAPAASEGDVAFEEAEAFAVAAPAPPPPPPPMCGNGNAAGGQMKGVGWTCEINAAGSNLCCDTNLGLTCAFTGKIPFGTECIVNPNNPNPNPLPNPNPGPTPVPNPGA